MTTTWMPIYWGDYFKNTTHLSTEEHGAYFLLIGHYWCNGKIPRDERVLRNITKISPKKLTNVLAFFRVDGAYYIHDRIEGEKDKAFENKEKQRLRTEAASNARWKRNVSVTESVTLTPSPSPSSIADTDKEFWQWLEATMQGRVLVLGRYKEWLKQGATFELIKQVITQVLTRNNNKIPSTLNYFDKAIADAILSINKPMPKGEQNGTDKRHSQQYTAKKSHTATIAEELARINAAVDASAAAANTDKGN